MKRGVDYIGIGIVFVCHDGNGKFLFAKRGKNARDGQGTWELPAGGLEYGETMLEGLYREVNEELCVVPKKVIFIDCKDILKNEEGKITKHWIGIEYLVEVDPAEVRIGEPDMCDAIEWRSLDDIPSPLHFGVKETIENVRAFLEKSKVE